MTITDKITQLITYLDARVDAIGGYALTVKHYDFRAGEHIIGVQAFPDNLEVAQDVADTLDLTFRQDPKTPNHYTAHDDGVEYVFQAGRCVEDNPPTITPAVDRG